MQTVSSEKVGTESGILDDAAMVTVDRSHETVERFCPCGLHDAGDHNE
jgi:hypothetical protein